MKRGDVYQANLDPVIGSEQGGIRPVVIIQNDRGNRYSPTVIVVAVTTRRKKPQLPVHVLLTREESGLKEDSDRPDRAGSDAGENTPDSLSGHSDGAGYETHRPRTGHEHRQHTDTNSHRNHVIRTASFPPRLCFVPLVRTSSTPCFTQLCRNEKSAMLDAMI